jgi:hypothetical protein
VQFSLTFVIANFRKCSFFSIKIRVTHEGLRQGKYVRVLLTKVPAEFCRGFNPALPVVLGGLQPHESDLGIVHVRLIAS